MIPRCSLKPLPGWNTSTRPMFHFRSEIGVMSVWSGVGGTSKPSDASRNEKSCAAKMLQEKPWTAPKNLAYCNLNSHGVYIYS